jgi:GH25 family lysozyme M1 (1,4-beta-N-acetylmuramidase)
MAMLVLGLGLLVGPGRALAQRPLGIDVSQYRGVIDWSSVKSSGISFAWTRATPTLGTIDPKYYANIAGATNAHVLIGSYSDARYDLDSGTAGAIAEAAYFWGVASNYVKGGGLYMMPMLDVEVDPTGYTPAALGQWINQWCTSVSNYAAAANCPGVKPLIYVSAAHTSA